MSDFFGFSLQHATTLGLFTALILAGLGAPIPEDLILITGGVLAHQGFTHFNWLIVILYVGVLTADVILYSFGRWFGDLILRHPWVIRLLTPTRRERIEHYFARYGNRTVFLVRHLAVLRAPTYLMAGAIKMPGWQFLLWDGLAALFSVPLMMGLGYIFADHIELLLQDLHRVEHWLGAIVILIVAGYLFVRYRDTWWTPRQRIDPLLSQKPLQQNAEERE